MALNTHLDTINRPTELSHILLLKLDSSGYFCWIYPKRVSSRDIRVKYYTDTLLYREYV